MRREPTDQGEECQCSATTLARIKILVLCADEMNEAIELGDMTAARNAAARYRAAR